MPRLYEISLAYCNIRHLLCVTCQIWQPEFVSYRHRILARTVCYVVPVVRESLRIRFNLKFTIIKRVMDNEIAGKMPSSGGKRSRTTEQSPSNGARSRGGYDTTMRQYRSVLMHPIAIPMVNYLNDIPESDNQEHPDYVRNALNDFVSDDLSGVFKDATMLWKKGNEKDLTKHLLTKIKKAGEQLKKELLEFAEGEKEVKESGRKGKLDLIFHEPITDSTGKSNDNKKSIVAMFEFGFESENWWTKQDQLLDYASMFRRNLDNKYKFDRPVLLSVVTINKKDCNEFKEDTPIEDINLGARYGVFLCVPKGDDGSIRITLLWRADTDYLEKTSCYFGKVLNAVQLCWHMIKYCDTHKSTINYEYLGPNCCRIGDKVRSFAVYGCL